jgi:small subunit ribosomal protein S5
MGKANEVPEAIRKGVERARRSMVKIALVEGETIPHEQIGRCGAARVLLRPASPGTGVIAGGPVRAICEVAGINNILTKAIGTNNPHNVVKATYDALKNLWTKEQVAARRGKAVEEI